MTDLSAAEPQAVRRGLATYVNRLLTTGCCPYADASLRGFRNALAEAIACQLTGHRAQDDPARPGGALEWGEFLTAGLYVHYLLTTRTPRSSPDQTAPDRRTLPTDRRNNPHRASVINAPEKQRGFGGTPPPT
ncbi:MULTISPECIES: hypothetical protein [unclassified Streptomyces]|uniref:hypothetical protein n=1 Tax=unclassified Streptomyces TaxID=2593676 RepID=UPI00342CD6DE